MDSSYGPLQSCQPLPEFAASDQNHESTLYLPIEELNSQAFMTAPVAVGTWIRGACGIESGSEDALLARNGVRGSNPYHCYTPSAVNPPLSGTKRTIA